ncbi:hypothetical protein L9F63_013450, partial [Diploptera punctata]
DISCIRLCVAALECSINNRCSVYISEAIFKYLALKVYPIDAYRLPFEKIIGYNGELYERIIEECQFFKTQELMGDA